LNRRAKLKIFEQKNFSLIVIMVIFVIFFYIMNPGYLGNSNLMIMLKSLSITGILGIGISCLLISGSVDLAASSVASLSGVLVGILLRAGLPWPLAILLTLVYGAAAGMVTAALVIKLNMMAFIATIGMSSIWQGIAYLLTRANPVKYNNPTFQAIGSTTFGFVPLMFIIMVVLLILYGIILTHTKFGRNIFMCGGNRVATRLAGIKPKKIATVLFINCGALSSLSGILLTSNMRKGDPTPITNGMDAITAAILGGVSFMGGTGGMGGLFIGLMLLNTFSNGLTVIELKSYWQIFAQGALLILALTIDFYREKARLKALKTGSQTTVPVK
jgi:ribose/xylose/arabinose/galactoside ABC-type transport system permease subunit